MNVRLLLIVIFMLSCRSWLRADVIFSPTNATWKVFKGLTEASSPDVTSWRQVGFDDGSWTSAPAPLYYTSTPTEPPFYNGGPVTGTVITDMINNYTCLFLRKTFVVTNAATSGTVTVQAAGDDGFIVWLNGVEIGRTNMPDGFVAYNGRALGSIGEPVPILEFTLATGGPWLREGTNVLAVQAFNWDPTSSDFGIMAGLFTTRDETPPAVVAVDPPDGVVIADLTSISVSFSEPVTNVDAGDLRINGISASSVNARFGTRFTFSFPQPATGLVSVAWGPAHGIQDLSGNLFTGGSWSYRLDTNSIGTPVISEFMADNDGIILDGLGEASDWIELYNPTAITVNLEGWKLRDSVNTWTFPAVTLPAGGYLLVFASGKLQQPYIDPEGYLHTNFKLDSVGESVSLLRPDDSVAWEYATPDAQKKGVSFGLPQTETTLTTFETPARLLVPVGPVPEGWRTNVAFDDSSWLLGQASAGYGAPFSASGGTVAYLVHTSTPGSQEYGGSLGMDFVANREVIVTELGCFDDNGDGLARTITTELWRRNDNGTPTIFSDDTGAGILASATFTPAAPGTLLEGSRFKPLASPLTLAPGAYTIIAWGYGASERNGNFGVSSPPDPWETQSGSGALSFVGVARPGNPGTFPTTIDGGPPNRYAAGTFKFAGPEDPIPRTQLQSSMQNVNATALMRVTFNVANARGYESLLLTLPFDDGCVIWLNGVEVARRNAPSILGYNSAATQASNAVEVVPLTAQSLVSGMNLLAIQGLNVSASDSDFFIGAKLTAIHTQPGTPRYFAMPTPGDPNPSTGVLGYVADTKFSVHRGFYDAPFDLAITNGTPGAIIRYTLDWSTPSEVNGTIYSGPIHIASTTVVRAFAYKAGFESSNVDTHSYLFANDVAVQPSSAPSGYPSSWTDYTSGGTFTADYGMIDPATQPANYARAAGSAGFTVAQARSALANSVKALPVISIVTDKANLFDATTGIYLHPNARGEAWERPASVELITTNGVEDWHASAGLHVMGLTSRLLSVSPKLNFMLVFNRTYGDAWLTEPFFGKDGPNRIKRIALRSNTRDSWLHEDNGLGTATYIADGFAKDSQLASGEAATRHRFCHLFLNGMYWGVYNPTERPESHWGETTFGGQEEDYDVINLCCPNRIDSGDFTEWQQLLSASRSGFATDASYLAIQGNNPNGTLNPALKRLLGVDSLIGFMINGCYHGSLDWPDNFFVLYDNVGDHTKGFRFVAWDNDLGFPNMNVNADRATPPEGLATRLQHDAPGAVDAGLRQNLEYRMRVADRLFREYFHTGAYASATNLARWQKLRDAIQPGLYAESARWGDYQAGGLRTVQEHWFPRVSGAPANTWFNGRNAKVISQLRSAGVYPSIDPPEFNQFGGAVPANFQLTLAHTNAAETIYYTLDGSDPRLPGGALAPAAQVYLQPITLTSPTFVRARVRNGTVWSAIIEAHFYPPQNLAALQLSEIMYNPPQFGGVDGEEFEFLELKHTGATSLELSGLTFTHGINFTFTNETVLGPGQYFVLARNAEQFAAKYPGAPLHGLYTGKLDNNGENITLSTALGATIFSVTYNNAAPWPVEADNSGLSLQRMNFSVAATNVMSWIAGPPTPGGPIPPDLMDSDGDGMPDGWEQAHGLNRFVDDASGDADGDGLTNYQEFLAGTDPTDEDDRVRLVPISATVTSGNLTAVLGFSARSNRTYSVVYRSFADTGVWTKLLNVSSEATNRFVTLTNTVSSAIASRFFRLATPRLP